MTKKRYVLSFIPIFGCIFYTFYLFLTDRKKYYKAFLPNLAGVLSFIALYLPFALICNATTLDLVKYEWLVILMLVISGIIWNITYFLILNLIEKRNCE